MGFGPPPPPKKKKIGDKGRTTEKNDFFKARKKIPKKRMTTKLEGGNP